MRLVGALGGQRGDLRLDDLAQLDQRIGAAQMADAQHQSQRGAHGVGGVVGDNRPATGAHIDQPHLRQRLERLAHGRATGAKPQGQLALWWQAITGAQFAAHDAPLNLLHDALEELAAPDGLIHLPRPSP